MQGGHPAWEREAQAGLTHVFSTRWGLKKAGPGSSQQCHDQRQCRQTEMQEAPFNWKEENFYFILFFNFCRHHDGHKAEQPAQGDLIHWALCRGAGGVGHPPPGGLILQCQAQPSS